MDGALRLMCVFAHPDDESLAFGGTLALSAAQGIEVSLVSATRGERGWAGDPAAQPGPRELGRLREAELRAAAHALGARHLTFLDYVDGELDRAEPSEVVAKLVAALRRDRPDVVVTFGPDGAYGHPDHIAVSRHATAAVLLAADARYRDPRGAPPHRVAKLYHRVWTVAERAAYLAAFPAAGIDVDGERRRWVAWPNWAVTARLDAADHWPAVWAAVACHRTQLADYEALSRQSPRRHRALWGTQQFSLAMSLVGAGPGVETDLFAGLRDRPPLAGAFVRERRRAA